jgi:uncharacterized membrane protein
MQQQLKTINKQKVTDLIVLLVLAGLVAIYCFDAISASTDILNLILVLPVTIIVLALCLIQFVVYLPGLRDDGEAVEPVSDVFLVVGLFASYVISLHWLGFDVGTSLFLGVFLWLHGERRWPWLFGYSISFAFALSLFFSMMLPYPMPMLLLTSAY